MNAGASEEEISGAIASLGSNLPPDYVRFLRSNNGGEGFVGDEYLIFWKAEELGRLNRGYEVSSLAPD